MRNTNIISQKECNNFGMKYSQIVKESVIPKVNDVILDEFWNLYTSQKVPDPKLIQSGNKNKRKLSDCENKNISSKSVRKAKEHFPENDGGNNVSLTLSNNKDIKKFEDCLVGNIMEIFIFFRG